MDSVTLELTHKWTFGRDGFDDSPSIPLTRAVRNLLKEGKPQGRPAICFCDPGYVGDIGNNVKWFGVFVHTAGNRVLFFPGFAQKETGCRLTGQRSHQDKTFIIDHLTLDDDFRDVHATMHSPKKQLRVGKPKDLGDKLFFWFGLSIQSLDRLRVVSKETIIRADIPKSDAARRTKLFHDIQNNSMSDSCIRLPADSKEMFPTGFFHVAVYIGPPGYSEAHCKSSPLGIPTLSPNVRFPSSIRMDCRQLPVRSHRLQLSHEYEIQLVTMYLPGSLSAPATFSFI